MLFRSGGLGPTQDDLTKEIACEYFNMELVRHEESYNELKRYFDKTNKKMTENNLKQAYFPKEAIVLPNPNGTAPGAILNKGSKTIIILPGPPKEMKPMFLNHVKDYLRTRGQGVIISKVLRILGIGESSVAQLASKYIEEGKNPTVAPYAKDNDVLLRITAKAKTQEEALKIIEPISNGLKNLLGDNLYAEGENSTLEEVVAKLLVDKKIKISTAESCTGGLIASRLISYPGISEVFVEGAVTYSNEAKMKRLNVKESTLLNYGAVSEETAREMAIGIARGLNTDISVVTTGIAGPGGGTKEKPVGLVYIGVYYKGNVEVKRYVFSGNREIVRNRATVAALDMVRRKLI